MSHSTSQASDGAGATVASTGATVTFSSRSGVDLDDRGRKVQGMSKSSRHWTMLRPRPLGCGMISKTPATSAFQRQSRHDQANVAGAEDDGARPGESPIMLTSLLRQAGGQHAGWACAEDADGAASVACAIASTIGAPPARAGHAPRRGA